MEKSHHLFCSISSLTSLYSPGQGLPRRCAAQLRRTATGNLAALVM